MLGALRPPHPARLRIDSVPMEDVPTDESVLAPEPPGTVAVRAPSLTRDLFWTMLTTVLVLVGNALLASLLARRGAADIFGPYNLVKRVGAGLLPFLTLGLTVGAVRFIAATADEAERDVRRTATVVLAVGTTLLAGLAVLLAPGPLSVLLLGAEQPELLFSLWLYSAALVVNGLVYSFYRAELRQARANWSNLFGMVLSPLAVVVLAPRGWSAPMLLNAAAALILAWNGAQVLWRTAAGRRAFATPDRMRVAARDMLAYSLPRIPGSVAWGFTLAIGPMAATRAGEPLSASHLLGALAFAQLAGAALQSFGTVLLPRVSAMHAGGRHDDIGRLTSMLLTFGVCASAFGAPLLAAVAGDVVRLWLGPEFAAAVPAFRVVAMGVPPLVVYVLLRSVLDGAVHAPVTSYAAMAGFAVTAVLSFTLPADRPGLLAAAYAAGQWVTGAWIVASSVRIGGRIAPVHTLAVAAAGFISAGVLLWLDSALGGSTGAAVARIALAVVLTLAGTAAALWFTPERLGLREALRKRFAGARG